jgi:tetratricopeptide (TPR) repeat protein
VRVRRQLDLTVQAASVAGQGNIIVQASGSARVSVNARIAIEPRVPHLVLTDFEARTQLVRGDASNDAALLSPYRTDVVPLLGRDDMLADLQHWLDVSRPISVRVMTGGAGRGKTRLAIELVRKATALKWFAGFATDKELDRFRGQQNVARWGWDKPTLVVIDYAASRVDQLRDWFGELVDTQAADRPGLRILLLERQAQCEIGWLQVVIGHGQDDASHAVRALLDPPEPRELPPVDDLAIRRRIYGTLLERDRADLSPPEPGIDPEFDRLLRDEKWSGDPLFLMMAGLVAGERGVRDVLTLSRADLAITVAQREFKRIGNIAARAGVDATHRGQLGFLLRHVAVAATLRQGLGLVEARQLIEQEAKALGRSADVDAALDALRDALPGLSEEREISPLRPDMVGEAAILIWLGQRGVLSALGTEPLTCVRRVANPALARVSQTLVRTAQDFAAAGRDEPVRWLESLSRATDADLGALIEIAAEIPDQTLTLRELAADLAQQITDRLRALLADPTERDADVPLRAILAGSLSNLSIRLSQLGQREEALAASQEAVDMYRRLAQRHPDAFLPELASGLNYLGGDLYRLGRREEALAASQEAVDIQRRLAQSRPDAFLPDLARSLSHLGNRLSDVGQREEALAASQEAVDIRTDASHRRRRRSSVTLPKLRKRPPSLDPFITESALADRRCEAPREIIWLAKAAHEGETLPALHALDRDMIFELDQDRSAITASVDDRLKIRRLLRRGGSVGVNCLHNEICISQPVFSVLRMVWNTRENAILGKDGSVVIVPRRPSVVAMLSHDGCLSAIAAAGHCRTSRSGGSGALRTFCLPKNGTPATRHCTSKDRAFVRKSLSRASFPLSPPAITQSSPPRRPRPPSAFHFRSTTDSEVRSIGPSSGSALMNRTAAGVCSRCGIRSSASCWRSVETPSQTLGRGQGFSLFQLMPRRSEARASKPAMR